MAEGREGPGDYATACETLDPADWEDYRRIAHEMLDRALDLHENIRRDPTWRPPPKELDNRFEGGEVPWKGRGIREALRAFEEMVLPYPTGNIHPRFWGWAAGTGSPMGVIAEALAAGLNPVSGIFNDSASRVEAQLLDWMKAALGFPSEASGILTSGGSMANAIGLAVGRDAVGKGLFGGRGIADLGRHLRVYASTEVHSSVLKAARLLGIGHENVRLIPVDDDFRIKPALLKRVIDSDRYAGHFPFAIVGNAGTINTGAVDDLNALADLAEAERLWLHVDGAFGALAALSPETRDLVSGLERADSLAFDFHKWMHAPYEAGCVLVRDRDAHLASFTLEASYLKPLPRGLACVPDTAHRKGPQLSRGFKALKVWLSIREQGLEKFGRLVAQNVRQARYLAELVERSRCFQLAAPVGLNVVAFRFHSDELEVEAEDEVNRELLMRLQESGVAVLSSTVIRERFSLRACICNHRSRFEDLDLLMRELDRLAAEIEEEAGA